MNAYRVSLVTGFDIYVFAKNPCEAVYKSFVKEYDFIHEEKNNRNYQEFKNLIAKVEKVAEEIKLNEDIMSLY